MRATVVLASCLLLSVPVLAQDAGRDVEDIKATLVAMWESVERGDIEEYASHIHSDFTSFGENDV
jgi:uncharacterized OsmC-like protein